MKAPRIGEIVIYNHPRNTDDNTSQLQSPAIVQKIRFTEGDRLINGPLYIVDMCVISNLCSIVFLKGVHYGPITPDHWCYSDDCIEVKDDV